jgi:dienelactone hydrolase
MQDRNEMLKKRIVYAIPGMEQCRVVQNQVYKTVDERDLLLDVYYPTDMRDGEHRPAVVFVHGSGPEELIKHIKDSGQYVSWGQLVAASGFIAVVFNHRSTGVHVSQKDVGDDVDDLVRYVREHAEALQIDKERLAIWSCSAGVPLGARAALREAPAFVKCFVAYYGPLELQSPIIPGAKFTRDEFSATTYLEGSAESLAPLLIVKAGLDHPSLNASIDIFLQKASAKNVTLDFLTHPRGHHAFDVLDDVARSHEIIQRTLEFMKTALSR